jgi:hypothetical protein
MTTTLLHTIRIAAWAALLLTALMLPSEGRAAPKPTPQPLQDSVTGRGFSLTCPGDVEVNAQSGPSGEDPTGFARCGTFLFDGPVTCLSVSGNVALLTVQSSTFGSVAVRITDNGVSGDRLEAFPSFGAPGVGCPTPLISYSEFSFIGDLTVVDAQPLPISTEQCKNGGWRDFGVFKNQGDCVSFVATQGKNPPGAR